MRRRFSSSRRDIPVQFHLTKGRFLDLGEASIEESPQLSACGASQNCLQLAIIQPNSRTAIAAIQDKLHKLRTTQFTGALWTAHDPLGALYDFSLLKFGSHRFDQFMFLGGKILIFIGALVKSFLWPMGFTIHTALSCSIESSRLTSLFLFSKPSAIPAPH
jgi:hypothetical protein